MTSLASFRKRPSRGRRVATRPLCVAVIADRRAVSPRHRSRLGRRSGGGLRALVMLSVAVAALIASGSALAAASSGRAPAATGYLFSIPTASGSLTGPNDQHLTLRLTGTRDYLTRFTDRPLRQAYVVANVDFVRRFKSYFASSDPNAVLTYAQPGAQIPVSVVLTIGHPRWNARHHTWTFSATRIRKQPDNLPGTTVHIKPPFIANPRSFAQATLLIDESNPCAQGAISRYADCEDANLAGANLSNANLHNTDLSGANLSDANLTNADLGNANLSGANLSGANLSSAELTYANLTNANLTKADLYGIAAADADLAAANLTRADLNYADLFAANLANANLTFAALINTNLDHANLCGAIMPVGNIGGC
jgi:uncharacterized protein YjbI with pentapeptide repeats